MTEDLILSFQDSFKAPIYKTYTLEAFGNMIHQAGFSSCKCVYRTLGFENVRKIFAPFYGKPNSDLSQILYGTSILLLVVKK